MTANVKQKIKFMVIILMAVIATGKAATIPDLPIWLQVLLETISSYGWLALMAVGLWAFWLFAVDFLKIEPTPAPEPKTKPKEER